MFLISNKSKTTANIFCAMVILLIALCVTAEAIQLDGLNIKNPPRNWVNNLYFPGYVCGYIPLKEFAPDRIKPACRLLEKGNTATANALFASEIKKYTQDLVADVGFLQSTPDLSEALLRQYQQQEKQTPSLPNTFKVGVLALYLDGSSYGPKANPQLASQRKTLVSIANTAIRTAYKKDPTPFIGFALLDADSWIGAPADEEQDSEMMLKHLAGEKTYIQYMTAKGDGWHGNLPTTPKLSHHNLRILHDIVACLYVPYDISWERDTPTWIKGHFVYVQTHSKFTPYQLGAQAYISKWSKHIQMMLKSRE